MGLQTLSRTNPNISGGFNVNSGDGSDQLVDSAKFGKLVEEGKVSFLGVRVVDRTAGVDSKGERTYTRIKDTVVEDQVAIARKYNLPVVYYDRTLPKNINGTGKNDLATAEAQGKQYANQFINMIGKENLKPGDKVAGDFEDMLDCSFEKGCKAPNVDEWKKATPLQRITFINAYMKELDRLTGTKAAMYTSPHFMSEYLPSTIPTPPNTAAEAAQYKKAYEELSTGRTLWMVDVYGGVRNTAGQTTPNANGDARLQIPTGFENPPSYRQIGIADGKSGNFALGTVPKNNNKKYPNLDTDVSNQNLAERVQTGIKPNEFTIKSGHKNAWEVGQVQAAINKMNLPGVKLNVNGVYDTNTAKAVKEAQNKLGVNATGVVDLATIQAMDKNNLFVKTERSPAQKREASPSNAVDTSKTRVQQIRR
jgi:Putative peptidoglycan binding domain